ncbi:MAG: YsnF/AvaK domain-containing protein, partial [Chloroflexia bacterium]|nr:YsnF/AvaK domain-containing protein [Chloroflexia bacterium]
DDTQGTYSNTGGDAPFDHDADTGHREQSDTINVALTEEELTARTRGVERGQVQIDKVGTSEERTLDVPVTEEQVHVTRRVVDRDVNAADASFEEGTIEVPVYGEEVVVDKRARVREEVEVSKDATTETERVSGTVRREDVRVTDDTGAIVNDDDTTPRR